MRERPITTWLTIVLLFIVPALALSQAAPQILVITVNGQQAQVPVTQVGGRNLVDVEALARATHGSLSFQGNQILLTLRGELGNSESSAQSAQAAPPPNPGFSKEFSRTGIEFMAAIREWRSVLINGVQNGYPIASLGLGSYQAQAQQSLRLASVAVNTDFDRNAYQLLSNEYGNMKKLSDKFIAKAQAMNFIEPDSVKNDALDQSVINCAHSLAAMASSGQFNDDGSCH